MSEPQPPPKSSRIKHPEAFWTAFTAFFTNLAVLEVGRLLVADADLPVRALGCLIASMILGGVMYGRGRLKEIGATPPEFPPNVTERAGSKHA